MGSTAHAAALRITQNSSRKTSRDTARRLVRRPADENSASSRRVKFQPLATSRIKGSQTAGGRRLGARIGQRSRMPTRAGAARVRRGARAADGDFRGPRSSGRRPKICGQCLRPCSRMPRVFAKRVSAHSCSMKMERTGSADDEVEGGRFPQDARPTAKGVALSTTEHVLKPPFCEP